MSPLYGQLQAGTIITPVEGSSDICAAPADGGGGFDLVSGPALDAVTAWTAS